MEQLYDTCLLDSKSLLTFASRVQVILKSNFTRWFTKSGSTKNLKRTWYTFSYTMYLCNPDRKRASKYLYMSMVQLRTTCKFSSYLLFQFLKSSEKQNINTYHVSVILSFTFFSRFLLENKYEHCLNLCID